jgi:GNAT superfamily N-acetyltransferase
MFAYQLEQLTKSVARDNARALVGLHNLIPNQHWDDRELLANRDATRRFGSKWLLSRVARWNSQFIGLCIAFEDRDTRAASFLYVHRLSVALGHRRRGVAADWFGAHAAALLSSLDQVQLKLSCKRPSLRVALRMMCQ